MMRLRGPSRWVQWERWEHLGAEQRIDATSINGHPTAHEAYQHGEVSVVLGRAVLSRAKRTSIGRGEWEVR